MNIRTADLLTTILKSLDFTQLTDIQIDVNSECIDINITCKDEAYPQVYSFRVKHGVLFVYYNDDTIEQYDYGDLTKLSRLVIAVMNDAETILDMYRV